MKNKYPQTHIELVTMLRQGVNDSDDEIGQIAGWVKENVGEDAIWHVSPCDETRPKTVINFDPPPYLTDTDLIDAGGRTIASDFTVQPDGSYELSVGNWHIDGFPPQPMTPALQRAVDIGKSAGLTQVIPKLDGH